MAWSTAVQEKIIIFALQKNKLNHRKKKKIT